MYFCREVYYIIVQAKDQTSVTHPHPLTKKKEQTKKQRQNYNNKFHSYLLLLFIHFTTNKFYNFYWYLNISARG